MTTSADGVGAFPSRSTARMVKRQAVWKPGFLPFLVTAGLAYAFSCALYSPRVTLMGWVVTVLWTLPVVSSLVGVTGAVLTRRRIVRQRGWIGAAPALRDRLVVLVPTIGRDDTYPALERSVLSYMRVPAAVVPRAAHRHVDRGGLRGGRPHRRAGCPQPADPGGHRAEGYRTPNGTRFKARANHYAHELRIAEGEALRRRVGAAHGRRHRCRPRHRRWRWPGSSTRSAAPAPRRKHLAQGILTYPRENAVNRLTWLADAIRPADDIARFAVLTGGARRWPACTASCCCCVRRSRRRSAGTSARTPSRGRPARADLRRRYPGRSDWFAGRCYGASPATMRDFLRQRERWSWGLVGLAFNRVCRGVPGRCSCTA